MRRQILPMEFAAGQIKELGRTTFEVACLLDFFWRESESFSLGTTWGRLYKK